MVLNTTAPIKLTNRSAMVSYSPMSRYPSKPRSWPLTATEWMPSMVTGVLLLVGSSITEVMDCTTVSFCMSMWNSRSMPNSKNSHSTPTVMEKQNAASAT